MGIKRVLIWANGVLLSGLVRGLSAPDAELEIVAIEAGSNTELPPVIANHQPDVLILESCKIRHDIETMLHLLTGFADLKVIMISCDDNWVQVYHSKEFILSRTSDLLGVIRS